MRISVRTHKNFCLSCRSALVLIAALSVTNALAVKKVFKNLDEAVSAVSAEGRQEDALKLLISKTGTAPSGEELASRADFLERMGLLQLAVSERAAGILRGHSAASQVARLGEMALITDRLEPLAPVAVALTKSGSLSSNWPPAFRAALTALYLRLGDLGRATTMMPERAQLSSLSEPARMRALLVISAVHFAGNRYEVAAEDLIPVTKSQIVNPALAYLQRGRIYFEEGKYDRTLEELVNVPRSNSAWYSGVMTAAWSAYYLKDYNLALGQLMSLTSPYLAAKYNPEAYILQSSVLYRLCHYQSALASLKILNQRYKELPGYIQKFKRQYGSRFSGVTAMLNFARGTTQPLADIPQNHWNYIADGILNSEPMADVDRALIMAEQGEKIIRRMDSSTSNKVIKNVSYSYVRELEAAKREALRRGVKFIDRRLDDMAAETSEALESAMAVDVEVNTRLRERLITGSVPKMKEIDFEAEVNRGYEFWPFQGEFWRDEAGSYIFATSDVCGGKGGG